MGLAPGTVRQHLFAVQGARDRARAGDALEKAPRAWILLQALERERPPRARKLGATTGMLKWIVGRLGAAMPAATFGTRKTKRKKVTKWCLGLPASSPL